MALFWVYFSVLKRDYTMDEVDGWVVASESCAFNGVGAAYHREVLPGTCNSLMIVM
jgi:glutamine phosphoribosylpyrophosphate amidotransferase